MAGCPACGQDNQPTARFCQRCAAPIAPASAGRRTVTVLFSDLVGSTALGERLDSEALREVMSSYFAEVKQAIERHGGTLEKYIGDAVMAVFGLPRAHEDDALRAVRAAVEVAQAPARLNPDLQRQWGISLANRTGVNTGEVTTGDAATGLRLATGDPVNTAARLEQAAPAGGVLLGPTTYRLVRDRVQVEPTMPLEMKGKAEPLVAYRVLDVGDATPEMSRRMDAPMVGRSTELAALGNALDRALAGSRCEQVVVLGTAGVGKSRLVAEFLNHIGEGYTVLRGRCLSYGEGITYWPVREAIRSLSTGDVDPALLRALLGDADDSEPVAASLSALAGHGAETFPSADLAWAFRRLLECIATTAPAIVVFDDVHWAEPTFLDLIDHVRQYANGPVLLVCVTRPETSNERPDWESKERSTVVRLEPLAQEESQHLIGNLLNRVSMEKQARDRVVTAAGGNPLFVEELIGWLLDGGMIRMEGERWVAATDLGTFPMPPTISALLAARLDALAPEQRLVLERGAVIGQVFYRGAVVELSPDPARRLVPVSLTHLAQAEFIQPDPAGTPEAIPAALEAFRFRHILIRDAAYEALLKRTRAELHEAFASWLEREAGDHASEFDEIVGYHLEQAWSLLRDVAPGDERLAGLAGRAAALLARAGGRAFQREDYPAAVNLLDRGIALEPDNRTRIHHLIQLSEVLREVNPTRAPEVSQEAERLAAGEGDELLRGQARLRSLFMAIGYEDEPIRPHRMEAETLLPLFERAGDDESLCLIFYIQALDAWTGLRMDEALAPLRKAAELAEATGDIHRWERVVSRTAEVVAAGPTPAEEAAVICRQILERMDGSRFGAAGVRCALALVLAMLGRLDEARMHARSAVATLEELGQPVAAAAQRQISGEVELMAGDPIAAERELRPSIDVLVSIGDRWSLPSNAAQLAQALAMQGRGDEARSYLRIARDVAAVDDVDAVWRIRAAEALVLAREGRPDEAVAVGEEAVKLADTTDGWKVQGDTLRNLAEVLRMGGQSEAAREAAERALDRYQRKGATFLIEQTRKLLSDINANVAD